MFVSLKSGLYCLICLFLLNVIFAGLEIKSDLIGLFANSACCNIVREVNVRNLAK